MGTPCSSWVTLHLRVTVDSQLGPGFGIALRVGAGALLQFPQNLAFVIRQLHVGSAVSSVHCQKLFGLADIAEVVVAVPRSAHVPFTLRGVDVDIRELGLAGQLAG